jgi:hypothetical protein
MAIARCQNCGKPEGRRQTYVSRALPVGYPNSSTICSIRGCEGAAYIWLNQQEKAAFDTGQRIFRFPTFAAKVRVEALA